MELEMETVQKQILQIHDHNGKFYLDGFVLTRIFGQSKALYPNERSYYEVTPEDIKRFCQMRDDIEPQIIEATPDVVSRIANNSNTQREEIDLKNAFML